MNWLRQWLWIRGVRAIRAEYRQARKQHEKELRQGCIFRRGRYGVSIAGREYWQCSQAPSYTWRRTPHCGYLIVLGLFDNQEAAVESAMRAANTLRRRKRYGNVGGP